MKRLLIIILSVTLLLLSFGTESALARSEKKPKFSGTISPLPKHIIKQMKKHSWRKGCPIPLGLLSYLTLSHWGFDGKVHKGEMVVHRDVGGDIYDIFAELFEKKFPIERMELVDTFKGNDHKSMSANNTSAFNCREVTGQPGVYSEHSYGTAIDINTVQNPYVKGATILPKMGERFANRGNVQPGMILSGDIVAQAFIKRGWSWGGDWKSLKDYQHFEKKIVEFK